MSRADGRDTPDWLRRASLALALLMLGANLLAWLRWGTDLPFLDDWRAYNEGRATSLAPAHLFAASNNTIAPVGLALDALAQRWLGGNPLPYQSLSMLGVLGGLLWLQWRLLRWATLDAGTAAVAFACTLFMLQSGSYWGEQSLAYHQALPLLALLGAALLNFTVAWRRGWRNAAVGGAGMLAGLSYVSGAVGALVMGASWLLLALWMPASSALRRRAVQGGGALALAGAATTALQLWLTRRTGADERGQGFVFTWPHEAEFWYYLAGKLGRASGHGFASLPAELAWVALLLLMLLGAALFVGHRAFAAGGRGSARARRTVLVLWPLLAVVLVYLALVSLGRAGLRDPAIDSAGELFRFAYLRFHFFWATLLWPWVAVVGAMWLTSARGRPVSRAMAWGWLAVIVGVGLARGVFDVGTYYRSASEFRAGEIRCLSRQLGSARPIGCPGFEVLDMPDWTRAYNHARDIGASFVRYLPIVEREGFGADLLRWDRPADQARVRWQGVQALPDGWMQPAGDPQMLVALPEADMARCRVLGVRLTLQAREADAAQFFFRRLGRAEFSEADSVRKSYWPGLAEGVELEFVADSRTGFDPLLRIDPADGAAQFRLTELRVACRLWAGP